MLFSNRDDDLLAIVLGKFWNSNICSLLWYVVWMIPVYSINNLDLCPLTASALYFKNLQLSVTLASYINALSKMKYNLWMWWVSSDIYIYIYMLSQGTWTWFTFWFLYLRWTNFLAILNCIISNISYMLNREYWMVRNQYSWLLVTDEDHLCANLRVHEQSRNMTSQCQYFRVAWCHRSTRLTSQC